MKKIMVVMMMALWTSGVIAMDATTIKRDIYGALWEERATTSLQVGDALRKAGIRFSEDEGKQIYEAFEAVERELQDLMEQKRRCHGLKSSLNEWWTVSSEARTWAKIHMETAKNHKRFVVKHVVPVVGRIINNHASGNKGLKVGR